MLSSDSSAGREDHGIAVVAIAFNEERDLPGFIRCLESWVDEIIIIDDGSPDGTLEVFFLCLHTKYPYDHKDASYFQGTHALTDFREHLPYI